MGGSDLLSALQSSLSGDPYAVPPGGPDHALDGGQGDPDMGLDQMLQALALSQMGVGGGAPGAGIAGVGMEHPSPMGTAIGLGDLNSRQY
jgi:hypothetical protein